MTDYLGWYFRSAVTSRLEAVAANLARFLPWGFFILPAAWWWTRDRDADRRRLLVWAATLIVLLSLSGEQKCHDPSDFDTLLKLQFSLNKDIQPVLAPKEQIVEAINRHYGQTETESFPCS